MFSWCSTKSSAFDWPMKREISVSSESLGYLSADIQKITNLLNKYSHIVKRKLERVD